MFDREKIIYLAGIIDGEGTVSLEIQNANKTCRKTDYYAVRLLVTNTNKRLIDWCHENFGGTIRARTKHPKRKQCYNWSIHSFGAIAILEECEPFMINKRRHAQILIEFMHTKDGSSWIVTKEVQAKRRELYQEIKSLNKQGI